MISKLDLRKIKAISDYQFGPDITDIIFKEENQIQIKHSKNTGRIKYIYEKDKRLFTFRPTNGFLTLSLHAAIKILQDTIPPRLRVIVRTDISEFIQMGRNVFCKHVIDVDDSLRAMDEAIVVNQEDELLAVGRLKITVPYIKALNSGIAIIVRKGIIKLKN